MLCAQVGERAAARPICDDDRRPDRKKEEFFRRDAPDYQLFTHRRSASIAGSRRDAIRRAWLELGEPGWRLVDQPDGLASASRP
jgi:hypothetical protein